MRSLRLVLFPFSAVYSAIIFLRNRLFDIGLLKSSKGSIPTLIVGNIAVGGTGKTPHTEYLVKLLQAHFSLAVLSRGYGRKTKGYVRAADNTDALTIGDEPYQIYRKFPAVPLAVCEDRLAGLKELKRTTSAELAILDDAFQHRRLKGDFSVLLTDYQNPYWNDLMIPAGNLRDNIFEKRRADIIVVTKCPNKLDENEMHLIRETIWPRKGQLVCFTTLVYQEPVQLSGPSLNIRDLTAFQGFAGIARPELFKEFATTAFPVKKFTSFADHHIFSPTDIRKLWTECDIFDTPQKALLTTEKDAMRIRALGGIEDIPIFYIPISVKFVKDETLFQQMIIERFRK